VDGVTRTKGLSFPSSSNLDSAYVGTDGNFLTFGHSLTSEDFIGYKNNTFYFKDSPGGGDTNDPDVVVGGKIDVNGDISTSSQYKINGTTVLSVDGTECVLVGNGAGVNNSGYYTTILGDSAGVDNEGHANTFIGQSSGKGNLSGNSNTFVGSGAGSRNTTGSWNTFVGEYAGAVNNAGAANTYVGWEAGHHNAGSENVFVGTCTGVNNYAGSNNVFLGYGAGFYESGSNKLYIANGPDASEVLIYGDFTARNLGFGTTSPTHRVTILSSADYRALRLIGPAGPYGYGARLNFGDEDNVYLDEDEDDKLKIRASRTAITGGNVGIGTTAPNRLLHLYGDANPRLLIEAPSTQAPELNLQRGTTTHAIYINGDNDLVFYRAGDRVTFTDFGDVGIGTTAPSYKLDVEGDIQCTNLHETSDDRLKTDVTTLTDALNKVEKLRGVSFKWNDEAVLIGATKGENQIGVLASEVEQVYPELVSSPEVGYKSVDYTKLTAVLIEAVKELRSENMELRNNVDDLRGEIAELKQQ
jgi:hypothetical protein